MIPDWPSLLQVQLGWGRDRARTLGELSEAMGAPRRALEAAVETLRRDGAPIVTGNEGVWLSMDAAELEAAARALRSRAITVLVGARALRATARRQRAARVVQATLW